METHDAGRPDSIARRLERAIQKGQFAPGSRLPSERDLAQRWQASRSIVREGISMLVAKGLLSRRHGSGTYVNAPSDHFGAEVWADMSRRYPDLPADFFEFRHMLECRAAELAAERHDAGDRKRLQAAQAAVDAAFRGGDRELQMRTDIAFHHAIAEATHNPVFAYLMISLHKLLHDHMQLTLAGTTPRSEVFRHVVAQHRRLLDSILARDAVEAGRAAAAHIDFVRVRMNHLPPRRPMTAAPSGTRG
ncbi:MAG TPA: FadR/GntR family transcriptional regulator [Nevskiaceae bacterium]|nr:FadR/GntR family transcriptional regulator [Nevskiaceae bacterium]